MSKKWIRYWLSIGQIIHFPTNELNRSKAVRGSFLRNPEECRTENPGGRPRRKTLVEGLTKSHSRVFKGRIFS